MHCHRNPCHRNRNLSGDTPHNLRMTELALRPLTLPSAFAPLRRTGPTLSPTGRGNCQITLVYTSQIVIPAQAGIGLFLSGSNN